MERFARILARYGQDATVRTAEGTTIAVRAIIQPILAGHEENDYTPLGKVALGEYLYLGEPGVAVEDRTVEWQGKALRAKTWDTVTLGEAAIYCRAILAEA